MAGALGTATTLAKETVTRWTEDKASALAAALAYYSLFSLAPLVLIAVAVAGLVFGQQAAEGQLYTQLAGLIGDGGAKAVQSIVANLHQQQGGGVVATIVGVATLLFGATGVFVQLQDSMNTIWKARPPTTNGIVEFMRVRLLSFSMVLGIGFLLLVSLILSAMLAAVGDYLGLFLPGGAAVGQALNATVSLVVVTALFAMIYKLLPDTPVAWRDVWVGALADVLPLHAREVRDRLLPGEGERRLELRGRGIGRHPAALGLLLVADPVPRSRVHPRVLDAAWEPARRDSHPHARPP